MLLAASVLKWPETPTGHGVIHMKIASNADQTGWQHQLKKRPMTLMAAFTTKRPVTPSALVGSSCYKRSRNAEK